VGQLAPGSQADMAAKANIEHLEAKEVVRPAKSQPYLTVKKDSHHSGKQRLSSIAKHRSLIFEDG